MSFRDKTDKLLDTALSESFFGEKDKVKYRPQSGGTFTIRGIFDESWQEIDVDTQVTLSSTQPNIGIKLNELAKKPLIGDLLTVRFIDFKVVDVNEDGQGGATLFLHKV